MFTGIIQEVGKIVEIEKNFKSIIYSISSSFDTNEIKIGDSVSINGVCQTVIKKEDNVLTFEAMFETINSTNFTNLKKGDFVNTEYAMKLSDKLSGHIVSGHIDTTGKILSIKEVDNSKVIEIQSPNDFLIEKGSISIDGISLTVQNLYENSFDTVVLPHTFNNTNLKYRKTGDSVNLEFDIFAKYIKKFTEQKAQSKITREFLIENGF